MEELRQNIKPIISALLIGMIFSAASNVMLDSANFVDSLIASIILLLIGLCGYILSYIVPIKIISPILWASLLAILVASPISPISNTVIRYVDLLSLNALITYILAYAGVIVGHDWEAFKKVGAKGVIVSIFVIIGTFLISSILGDLFMKIF